MEIEAEKDLEGDTENFQPHAPGMGGRSFLPSLLLGALRFLSPPVPPSGQGSSVILGTLISPGGCSPIPQGVLVLGDIVHRLPHVPC